MPATIAVPPPPEPLALTYEQAADLLGVSARTVWTLVDTGHLRAVRISRRLVRIPRIEVERFLAAQAETQPVP